MPIRSDNLLSFRKIKGLSSSVLVCGTSNRVPFVLKEPLSSIFFFYLLASSMSRDDLFTRVAVLNWLSKLSPTDPHDVTFTLAFLEHLRAKYLALAKLTTYKQFSNSLSHRQKHRMVLVFLLLAEFINEV